MNTIHEEPAQQVSYIRKQRGLSLIEVLIALLILSIGILGIAGLQGTSLGKTRESSLRTNAMILAQELMDGMRNNPSAIASYAISSNEQPDANVRECYTQTCSPAELAEFQLNNWWQQIAGNSRYKDSTVAVTVTPRNDGKSQLVSIEMKWKETLPGTGDEDAVFRLNSLVPTSFN